MKSFCVLAVFCTVVSARAQTLMNKGGIFMNNGAVLSITGAAGGLENRDTIINNGKIYVNGTFVNAAGGYIANDSLILYGDLETAEWNSFNNSEPGSAGYVSLQGQNQLVSGSGFNTKILNISGGGTKEIRDTVIVTQSLVLDSGLVNVNTAGVYTGFLGVDSTGSIDLNPSIAYPSYIIGSGLHRKRSADLSNDSLLFPVGEGSDYRPLTLLGIGTPGVGEYPIYGFAAESAGLLNPGYGLNAVYGRRWNAYFSDTTVPVENIKVSYLPADVGGADSDTLAVAVTKGGVDYHTLGNSAYSSNVLEYITSDFTVFGESYAIGSSRNWKMAFSILLEGPFVPGPDTMRVDDDLITAMQPVFQWGGTSAQTMFSGFAVPANAVDVVTLYLRESSSPYTYVDTALAWLMSDGSVTDFKTGTFPYAEFYKANSGSYLVEVRHRNHLPVMSSSATALSTTLSGTVDVTDVSNIFGGAGVVPLGAAGYGLVGGNAVFGNGWYETNAADLFAISRAVNTATITGQYINTDANLDSDVNADDYQIIDVNNKALHYSSLP